MKKEIWKVVPSIETTRSIYEVSSLGRVKRINKFGENKETLRKLAIDEIRNVSKITIAHKTYYVHKLMEEVGFNVNG